MPPAQARPVRHRAAGTCGEGDNEGVTSSDRTPALATPQRSLLVRARAEAPELAHAFKASVRGRDMSMVAAGLTYYAALAIVPWFLLAIWLTTFMTSEAQVAEHLRRLGTLIPDDMGALGPYGSLVHAGLALGPWGALVAVFPASFYGEGVRRACAQLVPGVEMFIGWRGRLLLVPLVLILPLLLQPTLLVSDVLAHLHDQGGIGPLLARIVLGFTAVWLGVSLVLVWVFRFVAPGRPRWPSAIIGALATGSFLSGFLQGFTLFLSVPVDLGVPFGGLNVIGGIVAVGLWLYILHLVFLMGWAFVIALDKRIRSHRRNARSVAATSAPLEART